MLVTLTGQNSFALQQETRRLIDGFATEHGELAVERLDGETAGADRVGEALAGLPFLAARKLVVLRGLAASKQLQENIEQLFNNVADTTDVVIIEPKPDRRLNYYKFLQKATEMKEFPELDRQGLARWLTEEAARRGGSLSAADARYLVERAGVDQQLLANELDKLLLHGPGIDRAAIDELVDAAPQSTVFQLLEAAFAGRRKQALKLYADQRAQSVEPIQIIAMLAWQLHVLAVIKTAGDRGADAIAKEAKLNPFVVRKSQAIARGLSIAELKKLVSELVAIDTQAKSTGIDADEALQHYLLSLAA